MDPSRRIGTMLALAYSAIFLVSGTGCSRESQTVADADKKIDLTLPKPIVHAETPQKPVGKTEAAVEQEVMEVEAGRDLPDHAANKPKTEPVSAGITTKTKKKTHKERAAALTSQQRSSTASMRPETVGDEVTLKKAQEAQPSKGVERYQQSDNPLHPSYQKK